MNDLTEAQAQFDERQTEALIKIEELKARIANMASKHGAEPQNWGYSGSLGHVNEELDNLLAFLGPHR